MLFLLFFLFTFLAIVFLFLTVIWNSLPSLLLCILFTFLMVLATYSERNSMMSKIEAYYDKCIASGQNTYFCASATDAVFGRVPDKARN